MKLGCTTPELLRNLGRDQASFMIDAFLRDAQAVFQHERDEGAAAQRRAVGIALCVLLAIAAFSFVREKSRAMHYTGGSWRRLLILC